MPLNILRSGLLDKYREITHGFLNYSGDIDIAKIAREQALDQIHSLKQVHSDRIVYFEKDNSKAATSIKGDSLFTGVRRKGVSVFTADCVPVIVFENRSKQVSAIHAGWRGTLSKIVLKTITRIKAESGVKNFEFSAVIGPSIGLCCYEVDGDVAERFAIEFGNSKKHMVKSVQGKYKLDLKELNRKQLQDSGVSKIDILDICTKCNTDYPSYRREGKDAGRMISFIGLL